MPGIGFFLNIFCVLLQYVLLFFLYYFLFRVTRLMYQDLTGKVFAAKIAKPGAQLRLVDAGGIEFSQTVFVIGKQLSLGRSPENDIVLNDTYVSHHHAQIYRSGGRYALEDLDSSNHTYLNGEILQNSVYLQHGDVIKIGMATFEFER